MLLSEHDPAQRWNLPAKGPRMCAIPPVKSRLAYLRPVDNNHAEGVERGSQRGNTATYTKRTSIACGTETSSKIVTAIKFRSQSNHVTAAVAATGNVTEQNRRR